MLDIVIRVMLPANISFQINVYNYGQGAVMYLLCSSSTVTIDSVICQHCHAVQDAAGVYIGVKNANFRDVTFIFGGAVNCFSTIFTAIVKMNLVDGSTHQVIMSISQNSLLQIVIPQ